MDIQKLIELLQNKISRLSQRKATAEQLGEIEEMITIEREIIDLNETIAKLRTIL